MNDVIVFGVDISKQVFHIIGLNNDSKVMTKRKLKRAQVLPGLLNKSPAN